jgi:hypothetical protein
VDPDRLPAAALMIQSVRAAVSDTHLRRVVVLGGSVAALTATESLGVQGFNGDVIVLAGESHAP